MRRGSGQLQWPLRGVLYARFGRKGKSPHDGIDLGLYCRASLAEFLDADELFTITRQGFDFFHREFGYRYPFGKYDQLFVPEFNAGAMENAQEFDPAGNRAVEDDVVLETGDDP